MSPPSPHRPFNFACVLGRCFKVKATRCFKRILQILSKILRVQTLKISYSMSRSIRDRSNKDHTDLILLLPHMLLLPLFSFPFPSASSTSATLLLLLSHTHTNILTLSHYFLYSFLFSSRLSLLSLASLTSPHDITSTTNHAMWNNSHHRSFSTDRDHFSLDGRVTVILACLLSSNVQCAMCLDIFALPWLSFLTHDRWLN